MIISIFQSLVELTDEKFRTDKCKCQIQNMACLQWYVRVRVSFLKEEFVDQFWR